jgi:hypothetical protein
LVTLEVASMLLVMWTVAPVGWCQTLNLRFRWPHEAGP